MGCPGCCTGGGSKKSPLRRDEASIPERETATRLAASNLTRCNKAKDPLSVGYRQREVIPRREAMVAEVWSECFVCRACRDTGTWDPGKQSITAAQRLCLRRVAASSA
jgi:hypothetical protein